MERLEKLNDWPSNRIVIILLIISIVLNILIYPFMNHFLTISGFPTNQVIYSELCFSGSVLKVLYTSLLGISGLQAYITYELLDYVFMIAYGFLIFSLGLLICRRFDEGSPFRKSGYIITLFGITAPAFDVVENAFILLTLTDPINFPDIWAVLQSSFSIVKWIMIVIALMWAIIASVVLLVKKIRK